MTWWHQGEDLFKIPLVHVRTRSQMSHLASEPLHGMAAQSGPLASHT